MRATLNEQSGRIRPAGRQFDIPALTLKLISLSLSLTHNTRNTHTVRTRIKKN